MPRYAFKIEYDGKGFSGWQRQKSLKTVQGEIEASLRKLDPSISSIFGAGRTDAGVHAVAQVAHCDLAENWDNFKLKEALNFHLKPNKISILNCNVIIRILLGLKMYLTKIKFCLHLFGRRTNLVNVAEFSSQDCCS